MSYLCVSVKERSHVSYMVPQIYKECNWEQATALSKGKSSSKCALKHSNVLSIPPRKSLWNSQGSGLHRLMKTRAFSSVPMESWGNHCFFKSKITLEEGTHHSLLVSRRTGKFMQQAPRVETSPCHMHQGSSRKKPQNMYAMKPQGSALYCLWKASLGRSQDWRNTLEAAGKSVSKWRCGVSVNLLQFTLGNKAM